MLFVKFRVGRREYMAIPYRQMLCGNSAVIWAPKQFLAERVRYPEVPLLPRDLGREFGRSGDKSTVRAKGSPTLPQTGKYIYTPVVTSWMICTQCLSIHMLDLWGYLVFSRVL